MFVFVAFAALVVGTFAIGTMHRFTRGRVSGVILRGVANRYSAEAMDARARRAGTYRR